MDRLLHVGQRVIVRGSQHGTIIRVDKVDPIAPYYVKFGNGQCYWYSHGTVTPIPPILDADQPPGAPTPPAAETDYQVGDIVRIKSREWYEANKDSRGNKVHVPCGFFDYMTYLCGRELEIEGELSSNRFKLKGERWIFSAEMFECKVDKAGVAPRETSPKPLSSGATDSGNQPKITVPLLNQNQLLTNIKLD